MSRYVPENHPQRGKCDLCERPKMLIVADFRVDAMLVCPDGPAKSRNINFSIRQRLCQTCHRNLTRTGTPMVHLVSRGITKRLTHKQTEVAARRLARRLKKMEAEL